MRSCLWMMTVLQNLRSEGPWPWTLTVDNRCVDSMSLSVSASEFICESTSTMCCVQLSLSSAASHHNLHHVLHLALDEHRHVCPSARLTSAGVIIIFRTLSTKAAKVKLLRHTHASGYLYKYFPDFEGENILCSVFHPSSITNDTAKLKHVFKLYNLEGKYMYKYLPSNIV